MVERDRQCYHCGRSFGKTFVEVVGKYGAGYKIQLCKECIEELLGNFRDKQMDHLTKMAFTGLGEWVNKHNTFYLRRQDFGCGCISPKGGATVSVSISRELGSNLIIALGFSHCSTEDNFEFRMGKGLSESRLSFAMKMWADNVSNHEDHLNHSEYDAGRPLWMYHRLTYKDLQNIYIADLNMELDDELDDDKDYSYLYTKENLIRWFKDKFILREIPDTGLSFYSRTKRKKS